MNAFQFTLVNHSGHPIYVYNFNYGTPAAVTPVGGGPLAANDHLSINPVADSKMRIYVSQKALSESLEKGSAPDPFNYNVDGSIMFSFAEYRYEPGNTRYIADLSYIDVYSYPMTIKFTNVGQYTGAQEGFEYGPTSLQTIKTNLQGKTDYDWGALIWPLTNVQTQWNQFPDGIQRIVGPNNAWGGQTGSGIGPWVPTTYQPFFNSLSKTGKQLFTTDTNWDGWQNRTQFDNPSPTGTGYTDALHTAATADTNGKYGFFCYPRDNTAGEFTYVPLSVACEFKVYPFDT